MRSPAHPEQSRSASLVGVMRVFRTLAWSLLWLSLRDGCGTQLATLTFLASMKARWHRDKAVQIRLGRWGLRPTASQMRFTPNGETTSVSSGCAHAFFPGRTTRRSSLHSNRLPADRNAPRTFPGLYPAELLACTCVDHGYIVGRSISTEKQRIVGAQDTRPLGRRPTGILATIFRVVVSKTTT